MYKMFQWTHLFLWSVGHQCVLSHGEDVHQHQLTLLDGHQPGEQQDPIQPSRLETHSNRAPKGRFPPPIGAGVLTSCSSVPVRPCGQLVLFHQRLLDAVFQHAHVCVTAKTHQNRLRLITGHHYGCWCQTIIIQLFRLLNSSKGLVTIAVLRI